MPARACFHCKQWIEEGASHDCWTTTEAALTRDLPEDLKDAWERLRETAVSFGDQRVYASHHSIMFSRKSCYFFVRPKTKLLEVWLFLDRPLKAPQVRRSDAASRSKIAHLIHIRHRDEVESPITDWLREAYQREDRAAVKKPPAPKRVKRKTAARKPAAVTKQKRETKEKTADRLSRYSGTGDARRSVRTRR
jgi:hypothetical protein